jgi:Na+/H+ antiporter NhaD/arsenite permease-like protein
VLVSSNPTNLVLSGAFSLSFITYASRLVLPVIVSAIAVYPILTLVLFRSTELIPSSIDLSDDDDKGSSVGSAALVDKHGAIFGSILVLITLGVLVGTSTIHVPVYMVTVPPAVIMFLRDGLHDWMHRKQNNLPSGNGSATPSSPIRDNAYELQPIPSELPSPQPGPSRSSSPTPKRRSLIGMLTHVAHRIGSAFPTVSAIVRRLPIPLVPFAFLMFILVQGLGSKGWVEVFATWWSAWIDKTSVLGAVGGMMFISCILCNVSSPLSLYASICPLRETSFPAVFSLQLFSTPSVLI